MIFNLLFPKYCAICGYNGDYLCKLCKKYLSWMEQQECIKCSKYSHIGQTHLTCKKKTDPIICYSSFEYKGICRDFIISAKSSTGEFDKLIFLTNTAMQNIEFPTQITKNTSALLCPIPKSNRFPETRFVNHSEIIAKTISKITNQKILNILIRTNTKIQKKLDKEHRLKNQNIFKMDKNLVDQIIGKDIIIIDDLTTTGSSLLSASALIMNARAKSVICYTLCKEL